MKWLILITLFYLSLLTINAEEISIVSYNIKHGHKVAKVGNSLTEPADNPKSEIDYFMLRGWKTAGVTCKVIEEKNVSDHRPLKMILNTDWMEY